MEITVLEKTDDEAQLEIKGEGHGFPNMLKEALLSDERVDVASYDIEHPLEAEPVFHLETSGGEDPLEVLKEAAEDLKSELEEAKASI